jgi:hypothetical protein
MVFDGGVNTKLEVFSPHLKDAYFNVPDNNHFYNHGNAMIYTILYDENDPVCDDVKITHCNVYPTELNYENCLKIALKGKFDIINISMSGTDEIDYEFNLLKKLSMKSIINVAAGNNGIHYELNFPAGYKSRGVKMNVLSNRKHQTDSAYGIDTIEYYGTNWPTINRKGQKVRMTGTSISTARYTHKLVKELCDKRRTK